MAQRGQVTGIEDCQLRGDEALMLSMGALLVANAIATIGNFYATGALRSGPAVQIANIEESIANKSKKNV